MTEKKKILNRSQTCTTPLRFQSEAHSCVSAAVCLLHVMQMGKTEVIFKDQQRWIARLYKERLEQMFPESARCVGEASKHFLANWLQRYYGTHFLVGGKTDQIITGYAESVSTQQQSMKPPTQRVVLAV